MKKQKLIKTDGEVRELTKEDFKNMQRASDVLPEFVDRIKKAKGRPKLEQPKRSTTIRLDQEVIDFFKKPGKGWQTRINDALKEYVTSHQ